MLAAAVAAALAAGGCAGPQAQPARPHPSSAQPASVGRYQACQRLLTDVRRHPERRGVPGVPALRYVADRVTAPRMAADARTAVRDLGHTHIAPVALALLRDDCARAGVRLPPPRQ